MFHAIGFVITGFIVGLLARAIMPGRDKMGILPTTLLGIAGAFLAGFLGRLAGWYGPNDSAGFVTSTIGAIVLLAITQAIRRRRQPRHRPAALPVNQRDKDQNYPRRAA